MMENFEFINKNLFGSCKNIELVDKVLSKMIVKNSLCFKKKYIEFLNELDKGFVWNFGNTRNGIKYNTKDLKKEQTSLFIGVLKEPDKYLRYVVKIQRILYNKHIGFLNYFIVYPYFFYTMLNFRIKNRTRNKKSRN